MMRTVCFALVVFAVSLSSACAQAVIGSYATAKDVRDIAVSPTGNQIAWLDVDGLSIRIRCQRIIAVYRSEFIR